MKILEEQNTCNYAKKVKQRLSVLLEATAKVQNAKTEQEVIEIVASAVRITGWDSVGVHLFKDWESISSVYLGLDEDEIRKLESIKPDPQKRAEMYGQKYAPFKIGRSYFVPIEKRIEHNLQQEMIIGHRKKEINDTWDPRDIAYIPMYNPEKQVIGSIALDNPNDGQRPNKETFEYLEFFADLVASTVSKLRLSLEQKKAKEALEQSERLFRTFFETAEDHIFIKDCNSVYTLVNPAIENYLGKPASEIIGKTDSDLFTEDEAKIIQENDNRVFKGEIVTLENTQLVNDKFFTSNVIKVPLADANGEIIGLCGIGRDITDRKKIEESLRESEEKVRALSDASFEAVFLSDKGICISQNLTAEKMFGYSSAEIIGKPGTDWIDPNDHDQVIKNMLSGYEDPYEVTALRKDGTTFPAEIQARMINYKNKPTRVTFLRDITKRKQMEVNLKKSEQRFRAIFETAEDNIFIKDRDFKYIEANPALEKLFKLPASKIIGKTDDEFFDQETTKHIREQDIRVLNGETVREEHTKNLQGTTYTCNIIKVPMYDENKKIIGLCGIARDITETKRLQALESRALRLETAGKIAGQIAHDFNNLLGPSIAYPELMRENTPKNHPNLEFISTIENAAKKMADINQQLLTLGRRGHYNQEVLNLNEIVQQAVRDIKPLPDTVICKLDLDKDLLNISGGNAQIYRIIMNLIQNALDAIQDIGTIQIITENIYNDDTFASRNNIPKGECVKLTISDNGCGIPKNIMDKIFDPFFTSKTTDRKRGSGLGLSIVNAVLDDHSGYLDFNSRVGQGASFYLYFPVTRDSNEVSELETCMDGAETVLVVDDDKMQREVSKTLLEKLGYSVAIADSGKSAIEILRKQPYDILILDMMMPTGMDGVETYQQALKLNSSQKALIVSGYSETEQVIEVQKLGIGAYIRKPHTIQSLGTAVRSELDKEKKQLLSL